MRNRIARLMDHKPRGLPDEFWAESVERYERMCGVAAMILCNPYTKVSIERLDFPLPDGSTQHSISMMVGPMMVLSLETWRTK